MKKWFFLTVCCIVIGFLASAQPVKHVVVITVDGFRPVFYLDSGWHAVHIRELMGCPRYWGAATAKGMTVASLLWPVSADAPVQYDIPDIGSLGEVVRERFSKPAGFVDVLRREVFGGGALTQVKRILRELPDTVKSYIRVIGRREMDRIGGNPEVGLALSGLNGAAFGNAVDGLVVRQGNGGQHGYFPDFFEIRTGFVVCGPGVPAGGVIEEMNERDIAPTVAKLLGLEFPTDGTAPKEVFGGK